MIISNAVPGFFQGVDGVRYTDEEYNQLLVDSVCIFSAMCIWRRVLLSGV